MWFSMVFSTYFNPRPPRGGRQSFRQRCKGLMQFQSTPSARRATQSPEAAPVDQLPISIHALREEGDSWPCHVPAGCPAISIHALREEGDPSAISNFGLLSSFQSTPSARRATRMQSAAFSGREISIHALREEGDTSCPRRWKR